MGKNIQFGYFSFCVLIQSKDRNKSAYFSRIEIKNKQQKEREGGGKRRKGEREERVEG